MMLKLLCGYLVTAFIISTMATCGQVKHQIRHKSKHKAKIHANARLVPSPTYPPHDIYPPPYYQYGRDTAIPSSPSPTPSPVIKPTPVVKLPPGFDEAPK